MCEYASRSGAGGGVCHRPNLLQETPWTTRAMSASEPVHVLGLEDQVLGPCVVAILAVFSFTHRLSNATVANWHFKVSKEGDLKC